MRTGRPLLGHFGGVAHLATSQAEQPEKTLNGWPGRPHQARQPAADS